MRGLLTGSLRVRLAGCLACATVALALVAAAPAMAALEGNSAFKELAQPQPEHRTPTAPKKVASTAPSEPTNSHTTILIALGAAVLVLSGIAVVIARDARRVAPAGDPEAVERDYARDSAARLRRRRAKAKAARRQRKRNRQVG